MKEAKRRLEEELWTECQANAADEAYRARGRMKDGRRFSRRPDPFVPSATPTGRINLTDPDSRNGKTSRGWLQGCSAQAATNDQHIVVAAELDNELARLRPPGADGRRRSARGRRGRVAFGPAVACRPAAGTADPGQQPWPGRSCFADRELAHVKMYI